MAASIGVDNSESALILKQDGRHRRRLNDLEGHEARLNSSRRADRQALRQRIIDFVFFLEEVGGVRGKRRLMTERFGNVRRERRRPNSVQIQPTRGLGTARGASGTCSKKRQGQEGNNDPNKR